MYANLSRKIGLVQSRLPDWDVWLHLCHACSAMITQRLGLQCRFQYCVVAVTLRFRWFHSVLACTADICFQCTLNFFVWLLLSTLIFFVWCSILPSAFLCLWHNWVVSSMLNHHYYSTVITGLPIHCWCSQFSYSVVGFQIKIMVVHELCK